MTDIDIPDGGVARVPTNGAKLGKTRRDEIFASRMGPVCRHLSSLLPLSLDEIHLLCASTRGIENAAPERLSTLTKNPRRERPSFFRAGLATSD
jgi:hypothetical protein